MCYYYRRIAWRLRNRKGKQRIARAARDALALKKKHGDTYDVHATASAATSVTDRVRAWNRPGAAAGSAVAAVAAGSGLLFQRRSEPLGLQLLSLAVKRGDRLQLGDALL